VNDFFSVGDKDKETGTAVKSGFKAGPVISGLTSLGTDAKLLVEHRRCRP
jgi:hypothetical protein